MSLRTVSIILALTVFTIWMILFIWKELSTGVDLPVLGDRLLDNLVGILPPLIIINISYEYFSKKRASYEISQRIMETLVGNSTMMDAFEPSVRRAFVHNAIKSLVGEKKVKMIYGVIDPYIEEDSCDIWEEFFYRIEIAKYHDRDEMGCGIIPVDGYYIIKERLSYKKVAPRKLDSKFQIGFFENVNDYADAFHKPSFIFRESIKINEDEINKLVALSDTDKKEFVVNCIQPQVKINGLVADIAGVKVAKGNKGLAIIVEFEWKAESETNEYAIDIMFQVPQFKGRSEVIVTIAEPTFSPKIEMEYGSGAPKVTAYSFLQNKIKQEEPFRGRIDICPQGWVYPGTGVIFIIEDYCAPKEA